MTKVSQTRVGTIQGAEADFQPDVGLDDQGRQYQLVESAEQSRIGTYMSLTGGLLSTSAGGFTAIPVLVCINQASGAALWALKHLVIEGLRTEVDEGESWWAFAGTKLGILAGCLVGGIAIRKLGDRWQNKDLQESYKERLGLA